MLRGFYTAASGIITQEKKLNTYANNISNVNTAGYKKDNLVAGTFGEHITVRLNAYQESGKEEIGEGVYMQIIEELYTDHTQGGFESTGRPLDMALQGHGFFVIANEEGEEFLTRDGQFSLDQEGYLVLPGYGRVQGENGDIQIGTSNMGVDSSGNIYIFNDEEGEEQEIIDKLKLAIPENYDIMEKTQSRLYSAGEYTEINETENRVKVLQMHIERSNVNMAEEMSRVLSSQRGLQSCSQIVKMYDEMSDTMNRQVAKV